MLSISILPVEKCQMISTAITAQKKHRRGFYVSQTYGAIQVVRSRRTHRRCGHHNGPVEQRMVAFCRHLSGESYAKKPSKITLLTAYPRFSVIDSASPPVSPTVVARILIAQNASVT